MKKEISRPFHRTKAQRKAKKSGELHAHHVEKANPKLKEKRKRNEPTFMSEYFNEKH